MSFNFLNNGQSGDATKFTPIDTFIDPVSKIRVSNPSNLIDTDFEYGLQPTKWETVEIINNTPAFFSKGGDTSIPDIISITTNAGTKEITVNTAFPHGLAVGIPIRVSGTKSVSADGSYIINATPSITSFTYLSRLDELETISIYDLYTSVITGEFFQGSQISIDEAEGITTDGSGPTSTLTIKTANNHGFGQNTPFYFLNLNSTITQEFESQNTTSVSFDPTNSGEAQAFDGSNTLLQTPIDLSNSATTSIYQNNISATDPLSSSLTLSLNASDSANWDNLVTGDPLYYDVSAGSGYFQANPRGIVFIKNVDGINTGSNTATFQVSSLPDAAALPILANTTGFFQIADQARSFAGNNINPATQIGLTVEVGQDFVFDGGNQGFDGAPEEPPNNTSTVIGYTGTSMTVFTPEGSLDYYVGAMLRYSSTGTVATGLANNATYFVTAFATGAGSGQFTMSVAALPGGTPLNISGGSGTQTFSKIGVSIDKNVVHIRNSFFTEKDMLEYAFPVGGNFEADDEKVFYFVSTAYDSHNYELAPRPSSFIAAAGGSVTQTITHEGRPYTVHRFTSAGTFTLQVSDAGTFDQSLRFTVENGSFGGATSQGTRTAAIESVTVVVNSGGRVDVAYPEDGETNDIPFSTINPVPIQATGGLISNTEVDGVGYRVHVFPEVGSSTFSVQSLGNFSDGAVEYLVIAGGGGGGGQVRAGGGGAGGYRSNVVGEQSGGGANAEPSLVLSSGSSYSVVVGAGGGGAGGATRNGYDGGNSAFHSITSTGGGGGGATIGDSRRNGRSGGSGGGGVELNAIGSGGGRVVGQGFIGGQAVGSAASAAGGGGAGGQGPNGNGYRPGGPGVASSITGSSVFRAGGGGGYMSEYAAGASGGIGGGGNGLVSGQPNTGGGGGGRADGGSGVVIVRYRTTPPEGGGI